MNTSEAQIFLALMEEIPDHRKGNAIQHKLIDIVTIGLLCIICNGDTYTGMELFGKTHEAELNEILELPHGIPSHDVFGDVFSRLDMNALESLFHSWLGQCKESVVPKSIAIDGKTIRGSGSALKRAKHIVTAYASELQLVLGQLAIDEKSNEITAIPELLDKLDIKGSVITIDAMGTQAEIAKKIIDKNGDYILALKENHPTQYDDIRFYMEQEVLTQDREQLASEHQYAVTVEKAHGRIERRECYLINDLSWLDNHEKWAKLQGAALIRSKRENGGQESVVSDKYFLFSRPGTSAEELLKTKRAHWAIENNLHWMLDVCFHEDASRVRMEHAAIVLNMLRKLALQLMKSETSFSASMTSKRLRCAWDFDYALKIIGAC